jgi:hypothetical protein
LKDGQYLLIPDPEAILSVKTKTVTMVVIVSAGPGAYSRNVLSVDTHGRKMIPNVFGAVRLNILPKDGTAATFFRSKKAVVRPLGKLLSTE